MADNSNVRALHPREHWILAALAEAPLHGYAMMERVDQMSSGNVQLGPATLYRTLGRLEESELIEVSAIESQGDRTRTQWRLTLLGRSTLRHEASRLEAKTRRIREALGGGTE